ncbi:hypothetical protein [Streptomyces sp. NBC_01500]|uniref:hypothetical protein n=1 Tax=Streptomyces sp. NBC_01500 TaxID=2903886 RepID=UPI0022519F23|nr:hypothetical protein [Streptomyces sp. NBC_01500]MCX4549460.1 hypothetical protein [Streptomyces sp. NBC_01500]
MLRLRIQCITWPRPALILTETPRPNCWNCGGNGGHEHHYSEYAGTKWEPCPCWDENRRWILLLLPRIPHRRQKTTRDPWGTSGYPDEPPF